MLYVLVLASGMAGLLYEVVWLRLLARILGNTTLASSAIYAAFMVGLAAGAVFWGRWADRNGPARSLRAYALLEVGVAAYHLFFLPLLQPFRILLGWVSDPANSGLPGRLLLSAAAAIALLFLPSFLMGGTLPLLARATVRRSLNTSRQVGWLYGLNTLGAGMGAFFTGFLLIPARGFSFTLYIGIALNLLVAAGMWRLSRAAESAAERPFQPIPEEGDPAGTRGSACWLWVQAAAFAAGFTALSYEVVWTRVAALILGPATHTYSFVLAVFIVGLGLGSLLGARLPLRRGNPYVWVAAAMTGTALLALATIPILDRSTLWIADLVQRWEDDFDALQLREFLVLGSALFLPTLAMGTLFPLLLGAMKASLPRVGRQVGRLYSWNSLGSVAGSLAAGLLLIPTLGSDATLRYCAVAQALTGLYGFRFASVRSSRLIATLLALAIASAVVFLPAWDLDLLASGAYKYAAYFGSQVEMETMLRHGEILYMREGMHGTVAVRAAQSQTLSINGKVEASDGGDMSTQKLLAHIPLLFSTGVGDVALIGLGSGATLYSVLRHPVEHVTVYELTREVVEASRYFEHINHRSLEDPRVRLIPTDARNHLSFSPQKYDVLISEPSNPWVAGMGDLFTPEFFRLARSRLKPGGWICQWLHTYNLPTEDFQMLLRGFLDVFPNSTLWTIGESDILLLASLEEEPLQQERMASRWRLPEVEKDLAELHIRKPYGLLTLVSLAGDDIRKFAGTGGMHTDDRPRIEFSAPRFLHRATAQQSYARIQEAASGLGLPEWVRTVRLEPRIEDLLDQAAFYEAGDDTTEALSCLRRALALDPLNKQALTGLVRLAGDPELRPIAEAAVLTKWKELPEHPALSAAVAAMQMAAARPTDALQALRVQETWPQDADWLRQAVSAYAALGDAEGLVRAAAQLRAMHPTEPEAFLHLAELLFRSRDYRAAFRLADEGWSCSSDPRLAIVAAKSLSQLGERNAADLQFQAALKLLPRRELLHFNYAVFLLEGKRPAAALEHFLKAVRLNPNYADAYLGAARCYQALGQSGLAEDWSRKAQRLKE